ncbi:MAG: large conductance mechanosensitive channel protein MscL [Anaerolineaceae bacterium]|nr:large conductance mechanosensitive channel protein MscL [Anaerolineaceae bacterium]
MLKEFKAFLLRGNVLDLAVAVIIGAAFGAIVNSLVNDIIMPPIGLVLGHVNFSSLFIDLSGAGYKTLTDATTAGAPVIKYGAFLNTIINFVIIALVIFLLLKAVNRAFPPKVAAPTAPTTKPCPYCSTEIPLTAKRCPNCTSQL